MKAGQIVLLLATFILQGCFSAQVMDRFVTLEVNQRVIELPDAQFAEGYFEVFPLTFSDGGVRFLRTPSKGNEIYIFDQGNTRFSELVVNAPPDCEFPLFTYFQATGVGKVLTILTCNGYHKDVAPGYKADAHFLVQIDLRTGDIERLFSYSLEQTPWYASFSYSHEANRGVVSIHGLYGTIMELLPTRYEPIDLVMTNSRAQWNLQDPVVLGDASEERTNWGRSGYASLQPESNEIAFLATFDSIGKQGPSRLSGSRYQITIINSNREIVHQSSDVITNPHSLDWNPVANELLIAGEVFNIEGLWIYKVSEGQFALVDEGDFYNATWDLAGELVYAVHCIDWDEIDICSSVEAVEYSFR